MIRHNGIEIDRQRLVIRHAGRERLFTSSPRAGYPAVMFKMWEAMILHSQKGWHDRCCDVYGECPDGGPVAGPAVVCIRLHQWRFDFPKMLLRLNKTKWSGVVRYQLVPDVV